MPLLSVFYIILSFAATMAITIFLSTAFANWVNRAFKVRDVQMRYNIFFCFLMTLGCVSFLAWLFMMVLRHMSP